MRDIEFGNRLRHSIADKKWTQTEFAKMIGVSNPGLGHFIQGRIPNAILLLKMSDLLNTRSRWLLTGEWFSEKERREYSQAIKHILALE